MYVTHRHSSTVRSVALPTPARCKILMFKQMNGPVAAEQGMLFCMSSSHTAVEDKTQARCLDQLS